MNSVPLKIKIMLFAFFVVCTVQVNYGMQDDEEVYRIRSKQPAFLTCLMSGVGVFGLFRQWYDSDYSFKKTLCFGSFLASGLWNYIEYRRNSADVQREIEYKKSSAKYIALRGGYQPRSRLEIYFREHLGVDKI